MISVKILGYHSAQRYVVRQTVITAQRVFHSEHPEIEVTITELKDWFSIEKYTPILVAPSLVVNEKLVCAGRFPSKQEILGWLISTIEGQPGVSMHAILL